MALSKRFLESLNAGQDFWEWSTTIRCGSIDMAALQRIWYEPHLYWRTPEAL